MKYLQSQIKHFKTSIVIVVLLAIQLLIGADSNYALSDYIEFPLTNKASEVPALFLNNSNLTPTSIQGPDYINSRSVEINYSSLSSISEGDEITINLFEDAEFTLVVDLMEQHVNGSTAWAGHFKNDPYGYGTMALNNGVLIGAFGNVESVYGIKYIDETQFVYEQSHLPLSAISDDSLGLTEHEHEYKNSSEPAISLSPYSTAPLIIDVMVAYTTAARVAEGGTSAINALISSSIAQTNQTYFNSKINQRVYLALAAEVNYDESQIDTWMELNEVLVDPDDGLLDDLQVLRNSANVYADLNIFMVNKAPGTETDGGRASALGPSSYFNFASLRKDTSIHPDYYAFAHELGHLMGAQHERSEDPHVELGRPYNRAYVYNAVGGWFTVMGVGKECVQFNIQFCSKIPYWSNPDVDHPEDDVPMGIPISNSNNCQNDPTAETECGADNRTVLNETAYQILNFNGCANYPYPGIVLFKNYFCGQQVKLQYNESTDIINLNDYGVWNDVVSSIYIPANWSIKVYQHDSGAGHSRCLNTSMWDLSIDYYDNSSVLIDDSISSIQIYKNNSTCEDGEEPVLDTTPPSATGFSATTSNNIANITTSNVLDNAGGSGVLEVRFSAKWNNQWHGIGVDGTSPYSFSWDMCASGVPDGDVELGMEVWDNASNKWVWSEHFPNPHIAKSYNCNNSGVVNFYRDANYQGELLHSLGPGFYNDPNPPIKSMDMPNGWSVITFKEDNAGGDSHCWWEDEPNFEDTEDWSNQLRSVQIFSSYVCPPRAKFDAWPNFLSPSPAPATISFHNISRGEVTSCFWEYGDGTTGDACSLYHDHVYTSPGIYTVKLTVSNQNGSDSQTISDYIVVTGPPESPSNMQVTGTSVDSVSFSWADNANNETAFNIYRWGFDGSEWRFVFLDSVSANVTNYTDSGLNCETTYFYQVTAVNQYGESVSPQFIEATTLDCPCATPGSVNLIAPFSNVTLYDHRPQFDWNPASDANRYQMEIATNTNFTNVVYSVDTTSTAFSFFGASTSLADGTYYWRVLGRNDLDSCNSFGVWSETRTLTIDTLDAPELTYPEDEWGQVTSYIPFDWSDVPNANRYQIQVDSESDFSSPIIEEEESLSYYLYLSNPALGVGTYYWRVRAGVNGYFSDQWSDVWSFSIIPSCPSITAWQGEYWDNEELSGARALCRNDNDVDFVWQGNSPDPSINADYFSARWTRNLDFSEGTYTFSVLYDDGIRLYIDDDLVIDNWCDNCVEMSEVEVDMSEGEHLIKLEYREHEGWASVRLSILDPDSVQVGEQFVYLPIAIKP
jgi:PKD repeat protein